MPIQHLFQRVRGALPGSPLWPWGPIFSTAVMLGGLLLVSPLPIH